MDFKELVNCSVSACEVMYLSLDLPWSNAINVNIIPVSFYHCAFGGYYN